MSTKNNIAKIGGNASHVLIGQLLDIPCLDLKAKGPSLEKIAASVVKKVQVFCARELTNYCSNVAPGEGRILASMRLLHRAQGPGQGTEYSAGRDHRRDQRPGCKRL